MMVIVALFAYLQSNERTAAQLAKVAIGYDHKEWTLAFFAFVLA